MFCRQNIVWQDICWRRNFFQRKNVLMTTIVSRQKKQNWTSKIVSTLKIFLMHYYAVSSFKTLFVDMTLRLFNNAQKLWKVRDLTKEVGKVTLLELSGKLLMLRYLLQKEKFLRDLCYLLRIFSSRGNKNLYSDTDPAAAGAAAGSAAGFAFTTAFAVVQRAR